MIKYLIIDIFEFLDDIFVDYLFSLKLFEIETMHKVVKNRKDHHPAN